MADLDALMAAVRDRVTDVVELAGDALDADAPVERMHGYVTRALDLLAEAEAQAVLAAGGDAAAFSAIERCDERLDELLRKVVVELER